MAEPFRILTVTWSADRTHFSLLRDSLAWSKLAHIPHDVVVQSEDLPLFQQYVEGPVSLLSTQQLLPPQVEASRLRALRWQQSAGRSLTRMLGSLARYVGWPEWVRYTGWHIQQISKLAHVARSTTDTVVIMDSDVVVTPHANVQDFIVPGGALCFSHWEKRENVKGKARNWQATAQQVFGGAPADAERFDTYTDTPFVMHAPSVRNMLAWLERRNSRPWWQVLLSLPPRRWSEFCLYKKYLRNASDTPVEWQGTEKFGYLFDASEPGRLVREFKQQMQAENRHFVTIHSQSSGRRLWQAEPYADEIRELLSSHRVRRDSP